MPIKTFKDVRCLEVQVRGRLDNAGQHNRLLPRQPFNTNSLLSSEQANPTQNGHIELRSLLSLVYYQGQLTKSSKIVVINRYRVRCNTIVPIKTANI